MPIFNHTDLAQIEIPPGSCAVRAGSITGPYGTTAALSMWADGHEHVAVMSPDYITALRDKLNELLDAGQREGWTWNSEAHDHA